MRQHVGRHGTQQEPDRLKTWLPLSALALPGVGTGLLVAAAVALLAPLFGVELPSRRATDEPELEAAPAVAST